MRWHYFRVYDKNSGLMIVDSPYPIIKLHASNKAYWFESGQPPDGTGVYSLPVEDDALFERFTVERQGYRTAESVEEPSQSAEAPTDVYLDLIHAQNLLFYLPTLILGAVFILLGGET